MSTSGWIGRKVSGWLPSGKSKSGATSEPQDSSLEGRNNKPFAAKEAQARSSKERLNATLRHKEEALSLRVLRRTLSELKAIVDPSVSEVEGGKRARGVANWYSKAPPNSAKTAGC